MSNDLDSDRLTTYLTSGNDGELKGRKKRCAPKVDPVESLKEIFNAQRREGFSKDDALRALQVHRLVKASRRA